MAETITSIASLLWPLLVLVALLSFRRPLLRVVRSAERREVSVEVGGQTITLKQLSDQQGDLITDLQTQLARLRADVARLEATVQSTVPNLEAPVPPPPLPPEPPPAPAPAPAPTVPTHGSDPQSWGQYGAPPDAYYTDYDADYDAADSTRYGEAISTPGSAPQRPAGKRKPVATAGPLTARRPDLLLWVDDQPENNAVLAESLQRVGVTVELATTTGEALRKLSRKPYGAIVSDMGLAEGERYVPDAGRQLVRAVRQHDPTMPVLLYTSPEAVSVYGEPTLSDGADLVTTSPVELLDKLHDLGIAARS